ncbi:hypothetical protein TrRE_jg9487 [Triparma retinervis]|uniref:Enkurin domain-containing protein n=1 Tax=Triparma retinervis TaxID=2557542 RepID=A0A9W6ZSI4_9STRA|nr:hypothetical protein TrRE_jg9487 [Triparma retinervis]
MNTSRSAVSHSVVSHAAVERSPHKQAAIARRKMMSGSQARSLIAPLNGFRGAQAARGQSVKNHAAENRRALKEMQRKNMEKEAIEKQKTSRGLSKMKQFQGVQSKINNGINANALRDEYEEEEEMPFQASGEENNKPLWQKKHNNFLKKKTGDYVDSMTMAMKNLGKNNEEILAKPSPRLEEKRSQPRKPTLHTQRASLKPRHQKDYLNQNKAKIIGAMPTSRVGDSDNSPYKHKSHGQIPDYLKKRKQTWEEEEKIRQLNKADEDCPDGMTLMPENERLETLRVLNESETLTKNELFSMPLTVQTLAHKKKKNALEAKLKEIEDAVKIFNRPKVFISMD